MKKTYLHTTIKAMLKQIDTILQEQKSLNIQKKS